MLDPPAAARSAGCWAAAPSWQVSDWPHQGEAAARKPGGGAALRFLRVPETKATRNRLHPDSEAGSSPSGIERLAGPGTRTAQSSESHTAMQDPAGNELCVTGVPNS